MEENPPLAPLHLAEYDSACSKPSGSEQFSVDTTSPLRDASDIEASSMLQDGGALMQAPLTTLQILLKQSLGHSWQGSVSPSSLANVPAGHASQRFVAKLKPVPAGQRCSTKSDQHAENPVGIKKLAGAAQLWARPYHQRAFPRSDLHTGLRRHAKAFRASGGTCSVPLATVARAPSSTRKAAAAVLLANLADRW